MQIRTTCLNEFSSEIEKAILEFWNGMSGYEPVWQKIAWTQMLSHAHALSDAYFVGVFDKEKLLAYALIEKRSIGFGQFGLFCIGGPNIYSHEVQLEEAMIVLTRQCNAVFLQLEPVTEYTFECFAYGEYKGFIEKHTLLVDITASEDDILAQMHQKGRYNIRLAEKQGVSVRHSDGNSADIDAFMALLSETLERDGFAGNSRKYYEALLASRKGPEEGLYLAQKDGEVIAAAILVIEGKTAIYYYGASTSDNAKRKFMPAYLLQWQMMRAGKSAGCTQYDFLGIAPN